MQNNVGYKNILKKWQYMKLLIAGLVNRFGDSIDTIASAWIVYELTSNAMWSALLFAVNKLPSVFVTPFAGAWVEGKKKKTIMVITDLIRAFCVAFVATGFLFDFLKPWMLILTTLIISTAESFRLPAGIAIIPKLLNEEELSYGMSLSSALGTVVEIIGLAVAAGIIAIVGTAGAIYIDMMTFIISALIISSIKIMTDTSTNMNNNMCEYLANLKEGFKYVINNKIIRFLVIFVAFLNGILVPLNSLLAPFANEILNGGAEILSIISIALSVGMLIGTVAYPILSKYVNKEVFVIGGGLYIGIYYIVVILAKPIYFNVIFMYLFTTATCFMLGMFVSLLSAFLQVECISLVNEEYLARSASILNAMGNAVMPAMSLIISLLATTLSTEMIFLVMGTIDVIVCIYVIFSHVLSDLFNSQAVSSLQEISG